MFETICTATVGGARGAAAPEKLSVEELRLTVWPSLTVTLMCRFPSLSALMLSLTLLPAAAEPVFASLPLT